MEKKEILWWDDYEVDEDGNIYRKKDCKLMKQYVQKNGYSVVYLKKNGWVSAVPVHRIVAEAFIPREDGKDIVDHINTIRSDNRVENLRWADPKDNANNETTKENRKKSIQKRQNIKKVE